MLSESGRLESYFVFCGQCRHRQPIITSFMLKNCRLDNNTFETDLGMEQIYKIGVRRRVCLYLITIPISMISEISFYHKRIICYISFMYAFPLSNSQSSISLTTTTKVTVKTITE